MDWRKKTWTVSEIMAERPCYTEARVRRLFKGRQRLNWEAVLRLKIPSRDKVWLISRLYTPAWTERIVTRAVANHALKCGVSAVEKWAARWLAGEDRTVEAAGAAAEAAEAAGAAGTAWAVARAVEAAARAVEAAAVARAVEAVNQEYRRQVQDFRELLG